MVSVAFNNPLVIFHQARLLDKYVQDPLCYAVADNSSDDDKRREIFEVCADSGVAYIELPPNPFPRDPSMSHGAALNWIFENYLRLRQANFIGFLDHDIFPMRETSLLGPLERYGFFGHQQTRAAGWYLWPGFCFFSRAFLQGKTVDFMPVPTLDTGGGNWESLFAPIDQNGVSTLPSRIEDLRAGGDKQSDQVEIIGDWVHTINASHWKGAEDKDPLVADLLNNL
jgi:hypothetical protein